MIIRTRILAGCFIIISLVLSIFCINGYAMSESEANNTFDSATILPTNFNFNETVTGTLQGSTDVDYFRFTPNVSGAFRIEITSDNFAYGGLYGSTQLLMDGLSPTLSRNLTANQNYYIKVCLNDTWANKYLAVTNYSIKFVPCDPQVITGSEIENNSSFLSANILPNSTNIVSVSGSINQAGDQDYFIFKPKISGTYTIETTGVTDTVGYLYDNDDIMNNPDAKTPLSTNDDSTDINFKIVYALSSSNTYYIKVTHCFSNVSSGNYSLKISLPQAVISTDKEGNTYTSAYLYPNTPYNGQINSASDVDYFKFTPSSNGYYTIQTTGFNNLSGQVFDSNNQPLSDDLYDLNTYKFDMKFNVNSTYYIKIYDRNGKTGNYALNVTRGKTLPVVNYSQQPYDKLCWATAASMAKSYLLDDDANRTVEFARYYNGQYPYQFNIDGAIGSATAATLRYTEGFKTIGVTPYQYRQDIYGSVQFGEIAKTTDMSAPIIFLTSKHFVVVKGYSYQKDGINGEYIIYNDPWDGQEHICTFSNFGYREYAYFIPTPAANAETETNDSFITSNSIYLDNETVSSIESEGDVDYYRFSSNRTGNFTIETSGDTDTVGYLYKGNDTTTAASNPTSGHEVIYSDLEFMTQDDNSGTNGNCKINVNLTAYRCYYIKIKHASNSGTGNYKIKAVFNY
jgi:hypothetical protein